MPSKDNAHVIVQSIKDAGINVIASLPDGALVCLIDAIDESREFIHIPLTREEEGVGVCAGAYFAGARTALLLQNAGLLNSCNGLTTTSLQFGIPMLLIVLYAGALGDMVFPQLGQVTEPVLSALRIPYYVLDNLNAAPTLFGKAITQAYNFNRPVAILLDKSVL